MASSTLDGVTGPIYCMRQVLAQVDRAATNRGSGSAWAFGWTLH